MLTGNDSVNGNWTYGYDDFNRLISASKTGVSYTYDYDRFGNRWHQNGPNMSSLGFDANNRVVSGSGVSYDAAGNVTNDGVHSYAYDAENRIQSVDGGSTTYVYDAAGMRVRKTTGGVSVDYLYDLAGNAVTELNTSGAWTRKEVYAGSRHVATYKDGPTGQTYFSHPDWLGTERARTDKNGAVTETCTNLPFGDWQSCTGTSVSPLHFTGKQRDTETDNDYFGARYYVSRQGRWLTPDWSARGEAVPYASLGNPQTLNLYAYVGNNPVTTADADGHKMLGESRKWGDPFWQCVSACGIFGDAMSLPGGDVGPAALPSMTPEAAANALAAPLPPKPTAADVKEGRAVEVGQRPLQNRLLRTLCLFLCKHSYIRTSNLAGGTRDAEVLGDFGTRKNQEARIDDPRSPALDSKNKPTHVQRVWVTTTQLMDLYDRLTYFADNDGKTWTHPCPVCGSKYNFLWHNSNTFAFNMLKGVGITPPQAPLFTPAYKAWGTGWY